MKSSKEQAFSQHPLSPVPIRGGGRNLRRSTSPLFFAAGRRGGPSILVSPNEKVLSSEEAEQRLGNLSLFVSFEEEENWKHGKMLSPEGRDFLKETQEKTAADTPQKDFEEFLIRRLNSGDFVTRTTEEVFMEKFELRDFLGEGATSSVRVGVRKSDGAYFAVKMIKASLLFEHKSLLREVAVLSKIEHPNIIRLYEAFLTSQHLYLVMELAEGTALFDSIVELRTYNEADASALVKVMLQAVSYLHSQGIAHRDLKPENIIYNPKTQIAGCFVENDESGFSTPIGGTPGYKAPDMLFSAHYGKAVDVWSIGVITYILLCGFPPFFSDPKLKDVDYLTNAPFWYFINKDSPELRDEIAHGVVSFPSPFFDKISAKAKEFVKKLLTLNEKDRLTADEALLHPWIMFGADSSPESSHLLLDSFKSSSDIDFSLSQLPVIVQDRTRLLREFLERHLRHRPSLAELRSTGIYKSFIEEK